MGTFTIRPAEQQDVIDASRVPITRRVNNKALSSDISLDKTDIGLSNVDNTSDANKSVSYATTAGSITNQGSLATLSIVGASALNVTGNGTTTQYLRSDGDGSFTWDTPPDTNTTYTAGTGLSLVGTTFNNTAPNVTTDISITHNASSVVVNSSDGTNGTINVATTSLAGIMTASDKTKLDGIATGANNYSLPVATSSVLGGVKSGTDITIDASGNVSVNNDSHTHSFNNLTSKPTTLSGYGITDASASTHNHTLDGLSNTTITSNTNGEILRWNGTAWINNTLAEAGIQPAGSYASSTHTHTSANITDATDVNTANMIVKRDASGNFSAGTITATLSGNASTATKLATASTIGGVSFDGTANINLPGVNTEGTQNTTGDLVGNRYISGGNEKPNNTIFGPGKLKYQMLSSLNLGTGVGNWNDVIWVSSYTGGDVKGSNALIMSKDNDYIGVSRTNYDATAWSTPKRLAYADGVGASGTWGISITGNATTASTSITSNALNGISYKTLDAVAKAECIITGGGTITVSSTWYVLWSQRFILISNGYGTHASTQGYFDITCPTSGTITGVGGSANKTATASGIPLTSWESLYYILPIGSGSASVAANFRVVSYTAALEIPSTWIKICTYNGDGNYIEFANGVSLKNNQSLNTTLYDSYEVYSAERLRTARTINGVSFDGTANISIPLANLTTDSTHRVITDTQLSQLSTLYSWYSSMTTSIVDSSDPFNDGSLYAKFKLDSNANDVLDSHNGTASNLTYIAGVFGNAGSFNGSSSKVQTANTSLSGNINLSISAHIKITSLSHSINIGGFSNGGSIVDRIFIVSVLTDGTLRLGTYGSVFDSNTKLSINTNYHIAVTYDGSNVKLYINGVLDRTLSFVSLNLAVCPILIGANGYNSDYFYGMIDQFEVYTKALSLSEVQILKVQEV